jgi:hypothetical protein
MTHQLVSPFSFLATLLVLCACGGGGGANMPAPTAPDSGALSAKTRSTLGASSLPQWAPLSREFNEPGNIVIADQFNNRVIEIDPPSHRVVWSFGGSLTDASNTIVGTNDAERVGRFTLMAGTGVPPANPPFEPGCSNGCADNRVILVNPHGKIKWQYGEFGVTGSGANQLNTPVQATFLPDRHVLITDQANERVIEVNRSKRIVWQYGTTGTMGNGSDQLNNPNSAELLENGDILIADENNNRVIEVNRAKHIVWQYPVPVDTKKLNGAAFASRLENGNTLITDSNDNRVIEIDRDNKVFWTYSTLASGGNTNPLPTRAVRLRNGDTLISDQFNDRVIQVRKTGATSGAIVFTQGALNVAGNGFDKLNAPYDAKVVGDYTGLTAPFDDDARDDDSAPLRD